MNLREGKIGRQEGISLAAIAMCIGGLFTLDPEYTYSMGNASYITLPAAAVISLLLFLLIGACMKRGDHENLYCMIKDGCGSAIACIVSLILVIGFALAAYAPLASFVQIMHGLFFYGVGYRQILLYVMPGVLIIAWMGFETIGRTAKCLFIILAAVTAISLFAVLGEYESYRLYPIAGCGIQRMGLLSLSETSAFLPAYTGILVCCSGMHGSKTMKSVGIRAGLIAGLICAAVQLLLGMIFPYTQLQKFAMPLCRISHLSVEETNLTRLDKIAQVFWLNGSMLTGAFYIYAGSALFSRSFGIRDIRPVLAAVTVITSALILMEFDGVFSKAEWAAKLWNEAGGAVFALPLLLVSFISLFKRKGNRRKSYEKTA